MTTQKAIVIHPSETAAWYSLITEAESLCKLRLNEEVESYLVFLLMRFTHHPELVHSVLGLEFLEGLHLDGQRRFENIKAVGDKCLLFAGLFPNRAERKRVKISYFVDLGRSAYKLLSSYSKLTTAELFDTLSTNFVNSMDVLQSACKLEPQTHSSLSIFAAMELWQDTGSKSAMDTLKQQMAVENIDMLLNAANFTKHN